MAHIDLRSDTFGILSLFSARPETAPALNMLAEVLLRGPSPLTRGERELVAAYVSRLNECAFCCGSHAAFAARQLEGGKDLVEAVISGQNDPRISPKMQRLLAIAAEVQKNGRAVRAASVAAARREGATDIDIHDTVLIAAAFCMYNRYVDGLGTIAPEDPAFYDAVADSIVSRGYVETGRAQE
jgi:uncharacterized peroxidase-related enzyme